MYGERQQEVFLGHSVTQNKPLSEATAQLVDEEVRKILDDCYTKTCQLLKKKMPELHLLAKTLLEFETLSGTEIRALLEEGSLPENDPISGKASQKKTRSRIPATA